MVHLRHRDFLHHLLHLLHFSHFAHNRVCPVLPIVLLSSPLSPSLLYYSSSVLVFTVRLWSHRSGYRTSSLLFPLSLSLSLSLSLFARHCSSPQCLVRWPALLHLSTSLPSCPVLHSRHRHGQPLEFRCFARVPFARQSPTSRCSFCRHCAALSDWSLLSVGVCVLVVGTVVILVCAGCCRSCGSTRRSVRFRSLLLAYLFVRAVITPSFCNHQVLVLLLSSWLPWAESIVLR